MDFPAPSRMNLRAFLVHELHAISPLRRSSIARSIFRDYTAQLHGLCTYLRVLYLPSNTAPKLDIVLSFNGAYLHDDNTKRGKLQKFRYALFWPIFLVPELKPQLNKARKRKRSAIRHSLLKPTPPPLSLSTLDTLAAWLASVGNIRASLSISLGFHVFPQANEICNLQLSDLCF